MRLGVRVGGEHVSTTGTKDAPGQIQQVSGTEQLHNGEEGGHGHEEGGEPSGGRYQVGEKAAGNAGERDQARTPALGQRARNEIDHVRAGSDD